MTWWILVVAAASSYLLGSLSPADAAARWRGADLRGTGSGNPGATNAARTMGVKIGVVVGLIDVAKGFLPTWYFARYGDPAGQVAGLAAVFGHITSPFLHGRGGKGVATSLGAILAVDLAWALPVLATFGIVVGVTRRVGVGSVAGSLILVPVSLLRFEGWWDVAFAVALSVIVIVRHRKNLEVFMQDLRKR